MSDSNADAVAAAPPPPTRTVLVVGNEVSQALELIEVFSARKRHLAFPCVRPVKIESDEGILQADLVIYHRTSLNSPPAVGEPATFDVVLCCYGAFKEESIATLELCADKFAGIAAPKIVIATGLEDNVPHFLEEEKQDTDGEHPDIYSAANAVELADKLKAKFCYEISTRHAPSVRQVFTAALRAALDPGTAGSEALPVPSQLREARTKYMEVLREAGVGLPVVAPVKPKTVSDSNQGKKTFEALGYEQEWVKSTNKKGKTIYKNTKTGEKVTKKERLPEGHDADTTLDDRMKTQKKKFEKRVDKARQDIVARAEEERVQAVRAVEARQGSAFEALMVKLMHRKESLVRTVQHLQKEHDIIYEEKRENAVRADKIEELKDLKDRKDVVIEERVEMELFHEERMKQLNRELQELEKSGSGAVDREKKANIPESFEAVQQENRRAAFQLETLMKEGKVLRNSIKKVEQRTRDIRSAMDKEEELCRASETRMQRVKNDMTKSTEAIAGMKREQDFLANELIFQRGTQATIVYQLREWKRERKVLQGMLAEIKEKISDQETPIARYLSEEKRRAQQRSGMLILDEEDELILKARKRKAGDYVPPTNKQLMEKLHTEHDRLSLEYQFLCKDLGETVVGCDDLSSQLETSFAQYQEVTEKVSDARSELGLTLHRLMLVLQDLQETRQRALKKLENKEDDAAERLVQIQDALDTLLARHHNAVSQQRMASASAASSSHYSHHFHQHYAAAEVEREHVEREVAKTRALLYNQTRECEDVVSLRRQQLKAFKAVASERENLAQRIRACETEADDDETGAAQLSADVEQLLHVIATSMRPTAMTPTPSAGSPPSSPQSVKAAKQQEPPASFLTKALTSLHPDTQALVVKRCGAETNGAKEVLASIVGGVGSSIKSMTGPRLPLSVLSTSSQQQMPAAGGVGVGSTALRVSKKTSAHPSASVVAKHTPSHAEGMQRSSHFDPTAAVDGGSGVRGPRVTNVNGVCRPLARKKDDYNSLVDNLRQEFGMGGKKRIGKREGEWRNVW